MNRHARELLAARLEVIAERLAGAAELARSRAAENGIPLDVVDVYVSAAVTGAVSDAVQDIRWEAKRVRPKRRRVSHTEGG